MLLHSLIHSLLDTPSGPSLILPNDTGKLLQLDVLSDKRVKNNPKASEVFKLFNVDLQEFANMRL
jgi:hypothetical protein